MTDEVRDVIARAIHDHWQGAPGLHARAWETTCAKLPGQANDFRAKADAILSALREKWAVVPREPTEAMMAAARKAPWWPNYEAGCFDPPITRDIYRAMISKGEQG